MGSEIRENNGGSVETDYEVMLFVFDLSFLAWIKSHQFVQSLRIQCIV